MIRSCCTLRWSLVPALSWLVVLALSCPAAARANTLALGEVVVPSGSQAAVPLSLVNDTAVKAFQVDITHDPAVAIALGVDATGRGASMTMDLALLAPGHARVVALFDDAGRLEPGSGEVARLNFSIVGAGGSSTTLTPSEAVVSDLDAQPLPVSLSPGSIEVAVEAGPPQVQVAALRNPGRPRHVQIFVTVANGSGTTPSVTAAGSAVAMTSVGGGVHQGTVHVSDQVASLLVVATDTNANGTGEHQVTVTFD